MTGVDRATQALRELILAGRFGADEKVPEETVAAELGVSRTLARLALGAVEREGLLLRAPRRGFRVRSFTLDDLTGAMEVRGELEAMAARLLAERGLDAALEARMRRQVAEADAILAEGPPDIDRRLRWTETNLEFHAALIEAAANPALSAAFEQVIRMPLVSPKAIVFDMTDSQFSRTQLERAQADHHRVLDAIVQRKGSRAAEIMRDHSLRSAENKRRSFEHMMTDERFVSAPGVALIRSA